MSAISAAAPSASLHRINSDCLPTLDAGGYCRAHRPDVVFPFETKRIYGNDALISLLVLLIFDLTSGSISFRFWRLGQAADN